jgi:hypothetical protein
MMIVNMEASKSNVDNKITFSGHMRVLEEIFGEIDLVLETNRCSIDMKTCEKYTTINIREICKKFKEKNAFYSPAFLSFKPPLECPLKTANYTSPQSILNLALISLLPLDGYVWLVSIKFVSSDNQNKSKKIILCLNAEVEISKTRTRA